MKSYGISMEGGFIIQRLQSIPQFSIYDVGRFIYVEDNDSYYIGGLDAWYLLAISSNTIRIDNLDIGNNFNQLNAYTLPATNRLELFSDASNIEKVLENLATGIDIQEDSIRSHHIRKKHIYKDHLLLNFGENGINASILGCKNKILDRNNPINTNVQDMLDDIVDKFPIIIRKTLQLTVWQYSVVEQLYMAKVYYSPIPKDVYPIVQCYDLNGHMILPSKIIINTTTRDIEIWTPYKLIMSVVVVG